MTTTSELGLVLRAARERAAVSHGKNPRPPQPAEAVAALRTLAVEILVGDADELNAVFAPGVVGDIHARRYAAALYCAERARLLQGGAS